MRSPHRLALALLAPVALAGAARADDWPVARHDARRTGRARGRADLETPVERWRHYLGGSLGAGQLLADDVDGDGTTDVLYVAGGRAVLKHADDAIVWESALLDVYSLEGLVDLDADGRPEVLSRGARGGVFVLDGRTGRVAWELPAALRSLSSATRVGDLDGDGRDDLYVGQCTSPAPAGVAFSFGGGYGAARELWRAATIDGSFCGENVIAAGDVDGDGQNELLLDGSERLLVLDGRTGRVEASLTAPPSGALLAPTRVVLRNVDDDPALELVTVTNNFQAQTATPRGARRVAVFDHAGAAFRLLWEATVADARGGNVALSPPGVADLDGDGRVEVAFALYDATVTPDDRRWTLHVRDARTGEPRVAPVPGAELVGAADLGDGRATLLTLDEGATLRARRLRDGRLDAAWSVPRVRPLQRLDWAVSPRDPLAARVLAMQLDDDPGLELLVSRFDPAVPPAVRTVTQVAALDVDGAAPRELASFTAPAGTTVLVAQRGRNLSRPYEQPVLVTSDGYLLSLDRALQPTNRLVGPEFTIPGMRVGGYYSGHATVGATPVVGALDAPAVVVRDSRPALVRLDVRGASFASPPRVGWERPRLALPSLVDLDGDARREVVAVDGRDVVALEGADGRERWRAVDAGGPVTSGNIARDVLPLGRADGATDLVFARVDAGLVARPVALSGRDGRVRWDAFTRAIQWGYGAYSVADLTGDGNDDVVTVINTLTVLDGATGAVARENPEFMGYGALVVEDFTGDGRRDVYLHGSYFPDRLYSDALDARGVRGAQRSALAGAVVRCGDAPAVVVGGDTPSSVATVRPRDFPATGAATGFELARAVLAGGRAYAREGDLPAGVRAGSVGHVTAVDDLDGRGHPAVLVGSTDGWLYALDPCALTPRWALDFRYPVGEAVVADADGDGVDDVLVTTADGFLHGLGPRGLDAATEVRDTDPPSGHADDDVDEVETFNTLHARWRPVPGATSYQVSVETASGTALFFPDYRDVVGTDARFTDLPLRVGGTYRFSVIATGARGASAEARSDGVTVVDRSPPAITLRLAPARFAPGAGETAMIEVTATDRTALSRTRAELRDASGAVVRPLDDHAFPTPLPSRTVRATWDGADPRQIQVPVGEYTVVATATDVGGHTTTQTATLTVDPAPPRRVTEGAGDGGGCGCGVPGRAHGRGHWGQPLALGLAVGMVRRRRRA